MDNITRVLIRQLLRYYDIPEGTGSNEEKFHRIIKELDLDLSNPRVSKATIDFLLKGEFEYAYIQIILNSVIPEGPSDEFMKDAVRFGMSEDLHGNMSYNLGLTDKLTLLKRQDPIWVWQNHEAIEEFMLDSWEPYLKVKQIIDNINSL